MDAAARRGAESYAIRFAMSRLPLTLTSAARVINLAGK
jgi:hypothetical protein